MNRNFLFTALYAWGRTIDTEQLVGVASLSPRYYVSASLLGPGRNALEFFLDLCYAEIDCGRKSTRTQPRIATICCATHSDVGCSVTTK
jgi:hypothetical protein